MHPMKTAPSGSKRRSPGSWKSAAWTAPRKKIARPTPACSWSNPRPCCNGASWTQADKLAALAVEQRVAYGPFDAKPEDLLKRIAALRQQNNPAGPRQIDNRNAGPNAVGPSLAGRQQAVELMRQIRGALAADKSARRNSSAGSSMPCGFRTMPLLPARTGRDWSSRTFSQAMARNAVGRGSGRRRQRAQSGRPIGRLRSLARSHPQHAGGRSASGDDSGAARRSRQLRRRRQRCGAAVAGLQPVPTGRSGLEGPRSRPRLATLPAGVRV